MGIRRREALSFGLDNGTSYSVLRELHALKNIKFRERSGNVGRCGVITVSLVVAVLSVTAIVWAAIFSVVYGELSRRIEEQGKAIAELRCRIAVLESTKIVSISNRKKFGFEHRHPDVH